MRVYRQATLIHPAYALNHGEEGQGWVLFVKDAQGLGFFLGAVQAPEYFMRPPIARASRQVAIRVK